MADKNNKQPVNAEGQFYVDVACVDCDLCRQSAPNNFRRSEQGGYSYVFKQPVNEKEWEECKTAMQDCPVEAIGCDGVAG